MYNLVLSFVTRTCLVLFVTRTCRQLLGLQQDLVGEGVFGGLGHVEVLEGVELQHAVEVVMGSRRLLALA